VAGQADLGMPCRQRSFQGSHGSADRHGSPEGVEEADELPMSGLQHAAARHGAVDRLKGGERGGDVVGQVVVMVPHFDARILTSALSILATC
jgi:hypothetical protein